MCLTITSGFLWMPVYLRKILQDPTVQHRPDLLDPKVFLSLSCIFLHTVSYFPLSFCLTHSQIHTHRINHHPEGPERKREKWFLSFFSFKWGSAAISVTDPSRAGHQTKAETFHTLLSFTTQSLYLFSHSLPAFSHFFYFSGILPFIIFHTLRRVCTSVCASVF